MLIFFANEHLQQFFSFFQNAHKDYFGENTQQFQDKLKIKQEMATHLSDSLLSKLNSLVQFEWTKQYSIFTGYILPTATTLLVEFWNSTLAFVIPIGMAILGDNYTLRLLSKF